MYWLRLDQGFWLGQATVVAFASVEFLSYEQSSANDVEDNVFGLRLLLRACGFFFEGAIVEFRNCRTHRARARARTFNLRSVHRQRSPIKSQSHLLATYVLVA